MKHNRRPLDDPRNVNRIVYTLYTVCALAFLPDFFYPKHPHFAFESWFGFYAAFGFVASVTLVLTAKQLRRVLRRHEDYYDPPEPRSDDE